jgi:hypothetical protein
MAGVIDARLIAPSKRTVKGLDVEKPSSAFGTGSARAAARPGGTNVGGLNGEVGRFSVPSVLPAK